MTQLIYLIAYLAIAIFVVAVVKRFVDYLNNPIHVRWELYPVAHEGKKASYGGGYLEEVDWWKKPREKSLLGELKVMIPEIFFLKAVWEHNRPLWYVTYPFHLGLYFIVGFLMLLGIGALAQLSGISQIPNSSLGHIVTTMAMIIGPVGFTLAIAGALGLIYKRIADPGLKTYSTPEHFFNLILFIVTMGIALLTWLTVDPAFLMAQTFLANLISFNLNATGNWLFNLQILLAVLTLAYIPLTHMSHFFMKYFLYHDIRWGDEPNINKPKTDAKIGVVLNYPVSWSAPHISGHGKETWAEVATFNPAAEPENNEE